MARIPKEPPREAAAQAVVEAGEAPPSASKLLATTVIIPVKNGGAVLEECLTAVFAQKTSFPFEVLCIDSGSTDGSVELIRRFGARLHEIPPEEFGHGRTRNLGVSLSQTPLVALLTQDAVPATDRWLEELIRPFQFDDQLAGVFGGHLPHPGCRPSEAFMLERHFAQFGDSPVTVRIGANPRTWSEYVDRKDQYVFFSDNNAALRKAVWEQLPYPDVEFMEDQLWAAAALEAGYGKAWAPRAAVRHSHNYGVVRTLRRAFDESRFRRAYQDPTSAWSLGKWLEHARFCARRDLGRLRQLGRPELLEQGPGTVARHFSEAVGRFLGDNAPFLPHGVVQALTAQPTTRPAGGPSPTIGAELARYVRRAYQTHGTIDGTADVVHQAVHLFRTARRSNASEALLAWRRQRRKAPSAEGWWKASVYEFLGRPARPLLADRTNIQSEELTVNWVIPPFGRGGGGHQTIFRLIHLLERRGISSRVYVLDGELAMPYPRAQLRALVHEWFAPIEAPVEPLRDSMLPADFAIATHWSTAYAVRALGNAVAQAYLVQDFEPCFYPAGSEAVLAEETYRMGFRAIAAGAWLAELLREQYGMQGCHFPLAVDHGVYYPDPPAHVGPKKVVAYMRPHTPRRAFELVALALNQVKHSRPDVEIHVAGAALAESMLPFPFVGHGVLSEAQLRKLYSMGTVGVCASLSNYSLVPQEMAACGCPVLDLDGENTRSAYPEGSVVLAPRTVEGLSRAVLELLDDETRRREQAKRGLDYAAALTWEDSAEAVASALKEWSGRAEAKPKASPRAGRRGRGQGTA